MLAGARLTGRMEELSALCGKLCSRWKDLTIVRAKKRPMSDDVGA